MSQEQTTIHHFPVTPQREARLIDLVIVLAKYKKQIVLVPAAVAVLSAALSFALPNVYKAGTKLLPPQQAQSTAAALLSQIGGAAGMAAGVAGLKNPNDLYIGMLKSRTIADRMIARFDLKQHYDTELQEKTRKKLDENTFITSGKDGLITIEVEDEDQKLVAKLTNAYVEELQKLTRVLAVTDASQRRMFYETQLEQSKNGLAKAEMALKAHLDTSGMVSVDTESKAVLETAAKLKAQLSAKEIQLDSMKAFVTPTHPDYRRAEEELASLRSELSKLESGRRDRTDPAPSAVSERGLNNIQLLRNVKYYQMLYELLAKQYEIARLDEAKEPSVIQVLDPAVEPEKRFKPKRLLITLLSTMLAGVAVIAWVFGKEAKRRAMETADGAARWEELQSHLRFK
jgi:uncharacterized protein involved in exopolysaccharide biosynthesis